MRMLAPVVLLSLAVACGGQDEDKSSTTDDSTASDTQGGETESESEVESDGQTPETSNGRVYCCVMTEDTTYFFTSLAFDDPQGNDTVEMSYEVSVQEDGTEVALVTDLIPCTDEGSCTGSFNEIHYPIDCDDIDAYEYYATIVDEDGNQATEHLEKVGTEDCP